MVGTTIFVTYYDLESVSFIDMASIPGSVGQGIDDSSFNILKTDNGSNDS